MPTFKLIFTAAVSIFFLLGCAADKKEATPPAAAAASAPKDLPAGPSARGSAEIKTGPSAKPAAEPPMDSVTDAAPAAPAPIAKATCENKIPLESPELTNVEDDNLVPEGKWKMVSLELYSLSLDDNGSFSAAATAADNNFSPKVDCNGLHPPKEGTERKTTASISFAEWVDIKGKKAAPYLRKIRADFVNGTLSTVGTGLDPNELQDLSQAKSGVVDKMQVSDGVLVSGRRYLNAQRQLEVRVLMEYQSEGKTAVQHFGRAVYELSAK